MTSWKGMGGSVLFKNKSLKLSALRCSLLDRSNEDIGCHIDVKPRFIASATKQSDARQRFLTITPVRKETRKLHIHPL